MSCVLLKRVCLTEHFVNSFFGFETRTMPRFGLFSNIYLYKRKWQLHKCALSAGFGKHVGTLVRCNLTHLLIYNCHIEKDAYYLLFYPMVRLILEDYNLIANGFEPHWMKLLSDRWINNSRPGSILLPFKADLQGMAVTSGVLMSIWTQ